MTSIALCLSLSLRRTGTTKEAPIEFQLIFKWSTDSNARHTLSSTWYASHVWNKISDYVDSNDVSCLVRVFHHHHHRHMRLGAPHKIISSQWEEKMGEKISIFSLLHSLLQIKSNLILDGHTATGQLAMHIQRAITL